MSKSIKLGEICMNFSKIVADDDHFEIIEPKKDSGYKSEQIIKFISYINDSKTKKGPLRFKTPRLEKANYSGIPRYHETFFPNFEKRTKRFSICVDNKEFLDKLVELDTYFDSDSFKKNRLGWNNKKIEEMVYSPILRSGDDMDEINSRDDSDGNKTKALERIGKNGLKPQTIVVQLSTPHKEEIINTKIIIADPNTGEKKTITDLTIDEFDQYVNYRSNNIYLLTFSKIWENKSAQKIGKTSFKRWGVTLKVVCVDCIPGVGGTIVSNNKTDLLMSDDEDEEEEEEEVKPKKGKKVATPESEEDDEEEVKPKKGKKVSKPDPESEEDEEEEVKPKKGKKVTKPEPESEEDEEEEVKPKKGKKVTKPEPEPEPEEDEEEVKPKKGKKVVKPPVEEDEEEEEEVKPKKGKKVSKPEPEPEEDEDEVKPKKGKKVVKPPVEEDDEEEEEVKPKKAKKVVKPPVEEDEEEEEEVKPKKGKKVSKPEPEPEEDEEEEEEVKPKKSKKVVKPPVEEEDDDAPKKPKRVIQKPDPDEDEEDELPEKKTKKSKK